MRWRERRSANRSSPAIAAARSARTARRGGLLHPLDAWPGGPTAPAPPGHRFHRLDGRVDLHHGRCPFERHLRIDGASFFPPAAGFSALASRLWRWWVAAGLLQRGRVRRRGRGSTAAFCRSLLDERRELLWKIGGHAAPGPRAWPRGRATMARRSAPTDASNVPWFSGAPLVEREQSRDCAGVQLLRRLQQLWIRATPTADAPAYAARANAGRERDLRDSARAGERREPDPPVARHRAEARSVTRSGAMNRCPTKGSRCGLEQGR